MTLRLNNCAYQGHRLISAAVIHEMEMPQIIIPPDNTFTHGLNPQAHLLAYSLALRLDDYRGERIVWHTVTLTA